VELYRRGKPMSSEEIRSSANLPTKNRTGTDLALNPGFRGEMPATNHLRYKIIMRIFHSAGQKPLITIESPMFVIHSLSKIYSSNSYLVLYLMCVGPCIVVINEEKEPTRCYLVFYYTYDRLLLESSSSSLQPGHLASQPATNRQPPAT
jgi:hypothetical protein